MILACNAATYSRSNGKSRYLRGQKWSIRAPFLTPHLVNPKHSATNSEEELSGWYHHAKLYADRYHRRRDICPWRKKNSSKMQHIWLPSPVALLVVSQYALPGYGDRRVWVRGRIIVSGYTGVCFEIEFSGRHRGFDGVLLNLWPLANARFRDAQY